MRVKKITIEDDGDYMIGALSFDQVEEIVGPLVEGQSGTAKVATIIATSLNNAIKKSKPTIADDDPELWTPKRITQSFDLVSFPIMEAEVLKFSNLRREVPKTQEGEDQAAQTS